jgi:hypothetical protein
VSDGKCPVRRPGDGQVRPGEDPKDIYRCMRNEGHQPPNAHVWEVDPEPQPPSDAAVLNARTFDGVVYLDSSDVIAALRRRADQATTEAESYGDELDEDGFQASTAWRMVASEMTERADELQFAVIAHQSEDPS